MKMNKINCIFWKIFSSCRYIIIHVDLFSISIYWEKSTICRSQTTEQITKRKTEFSNFNFIIFSREFQGYEIHVFRSWFYILQKRWICVRHKLVWSRRAETESHATHCVRRLSGHFVLMLHRCEHFLASLHARINGSGVLAAIVTLRCGRCGRCGRTFHTHQT